MECWRRAATTRFPIVYSKGSHVAKERATAEGKGVEGKACQVSFFGWGKGSERCRVPASSHSSGRATRFVSRAFSRVSQAGIPSR
jgi:hypothetical protein